MLNQRYARRLAPLALVLLVLLGASPTTASAGPIYFNDFESGLGTGWSGTATPLTTSPGPSLATQFIGRLANDYLDLTLTGLPAHTALSISLDFYSFWSWDGNRTGLGPDFWELSVVGGPSLLRTTFGGVAVADGGGQSYPGNYPSYYEPYTGNFGMSLLNVPDSGGDIDYHIGPYSFAHTGDTVTLRFAAGTWAGGGDLQSYPDETWGIDNVRIDSVEPVPEPASLLLLATGLVAAVVRRRRRQ